MDYKEIKKLIDDIGNSNLTSFDITFPDGTMVSMKKENNKVTNQKAYADEKSLKLDNLSAEENIAPIDNTQKVEEEYKYITSPMVGTFYLKASPDKDDFVSVGKHINKGDVACIIESMKLMNEIESEISGEVIEVLKEDGSPVEYGEKLFKIK